MSDRTNTTLSSKKKAGKDEDNIVNTGSTVATLTKDIVNIMEDTDRDALKGGADASTKFKLSMRKRDNKDYYKSMSSANVNEKLANQKCCHQRKGKTSLQLDNLNNGRTVTWCY